MTPFERRWRDGLLTAMIPALPGGGLQGIQPTTLGPFWKRYRSAAPFLLRFGFRVAVIALTWLPLFLYGRPFHWLSADRQERFLERAASSRLYLLRQLVTVVKLIACFAYFFDPKVQTTFREPFQLGVRR